MELKSGNDDAHDLKKVHEESVRGTLQEVVAHFTEVEPRGEIVIVLGTVNMSEGNFEITGENKVAVDHGQNSNFTLSGGTVTITSLTGHTGFITKGNLTIKGGRMNVNILEIAKGVTTTVEGGTLETGGLVIGDNGKLINNGTLIANGSFEGNGTIENTGTISGTGQVPEGNRTDPGKRW